MYRTMAQEWKPKKAQNGLQFRPINIKDYRYDSEGNIVNNETGETGTFALPEVRVIANNPKNYRSSFDGSLSNFINTINAMTGGISNRFSPTQNVRAVYDLFDQDLSTQDKINSIVYGNNGIVSNEFAEEHPILSAGANMFGDAVTPRSLLNAAIKAKGTQLYLDAKDGLTKAIYNNIAPGSYYESYIPGGSKKTEIRNAIKDFLKGNTKEIRPKWKDWIQSDDMIAGFTIPSSLNREEYEQYRKVVSGARNEAWERYLGLPTEKKYLKDTGRRDKNGLEIVTSNLDKVPQRQQQIAATVKDNILGQDLITSVGGNLTPRVFNKGKYSHVLYDDIWDLQPFKDANREKLLPKWIKKRISHIEVQPDGYQKVVWDKWVPNSFKNLEAGKLIGAPGPFRNITTIKATNITPKQSINKRLMTKDEYIRREEDLFDNWVNENDADIDWYTELNKVRKSASSRYDNLLNIDPEKLMNYDYLNTRQLLDRYGIYRKIK